MCGHCIMQVEELGVEQPQNLSSVFQKWESKDLAAAKDGSEILQVIKFKICRDIGSSQSQLQTGLRIQHVAET